MFYSKEILTRKKGGFGIIWLAATLGSRSSLKKLSKKEVNSVNLVKACEYVTSPPEPLALRLTSNLMIGITRVYDQQYHFYYADVNYVWNRLHRSLIELQKGSVDMVVPQARPEAITLEDDPFFEIQMTIPHKPQDFGVVPDFEGTINETQQSPTVPTPRAIGSSSNITRQSLITLPEVSDVDLSVSSISGFSGGFDAGFGMNDDLLMMDDNGIRIDFDEEGGLHEFEPQPDSQNEIQQQNGRDPLNSDMNEIVKRVREEHDAGLQENQSEKRRIRQKDPVIEDQELYYQQDDEQIADVQMDIERESMQEVLQQAINDDQEAPQQTTHDDQEAPQQTTHDDDQQAPEIDVRQPSVEPRRQKRRRLHYMYDEDTEMSNEQIIAMRDGVVNDLEEGERIARDKAKMQEYKDQWRQVLYTPGLPLNAPQLSTFWSTHCAPMLQDDIVKQRRAPTVPVPQQGIDLDELGDLYADIEDIGIGGSRQFIQYERDSSLQDIELERLRKAGSQSNSAITGLNSTGTEVPDMLDFNRASSAENISHDILEFSGQLGSIGQQRPSPIGLRPSISMSESFPHFDDSIEIPNFQIFGELEEDSMMSSSSKEKHHDSDQRSGVNSEQEQLNFMEFIKDLMQKAEVSSAIFQDIMMAQYVKRGETAKAFYNILGLATKSLIKVKQLQPYGDIVIELRE